MVRTASTMLPLGTKAIDFALPNTEGRIIQLSDFDQSKALVLLFICNHCPFVKHVAPELVRVSNEYSERGVAFVGISSNDAAEYPEDGPEKMREEATAQGYKFPYLYDESQAVAQSYHAACTPDIFVFNSNHRLVYRGQLDDSRPKNDKPLNGRDLKAALDRVLSGQSVSTEQRPSIGCNIKWKSGNEPAYYNAVGV